MSKSNATLLSKFSQYESEISSILGMLVVAALAIFIFLFVKRFMPKPAITPVAQNTQSTEDLMNQQLEKTYTVKAGQGLTQIAKEALGNGKLWTEIAKANGLKPPYVLKAGQVLKLPSTAQVQATSVAVTPAAAATTTVTTPSSDTYVVAKGDSLWKIAVAQYGNGYAWTKIYKANVKLIGNNPGRIYAGNTLVMPK